MSELMKIVWYALVVLIVGCIGAAVFVYYIIKCILNREDWEETKMVSEETE